jgi:branched-chain amino acid transport system ATP-binding protein
MESEIFGKGNCNARQGLDLPRSKDGSARTMDKGKAIRALPQSCRGAAAQMSGGEQQMLTVARTLMGNPLALLLDEPSEGVAPIIMEAMARTVQSLKSSGAAILLSEQNLPFVSLVANRAYVLEKGEIRFEGTIAVLAADEVTRRAYLEI